MSSVCLRLDAGLARDPLAPGDWVGAAAGAVEPWGAGSEPRDVCSPETLTLDPRPLTAGPAPRSARAGGSRSSGQPRQTPLLQTGKLRQTRGQGGPGSGGSHPGAGREGGGSVFPKGRSLCRRLLPGPKGPDPWAPLPAFGVPYGIGFSPAVAMLSAEARPCRHDPVRLTGPRGSYQDTPIRGLGVGEGAGVPGSGVRA